MSIIDIIDRRSPCAETSDVFTAVYGKPEDGPPISKPYHGRVLVHPEIELIRGTMPRLPMGYWSNADLAVILLEKPVNLDFQPLALSRSKVKLGDAFVVTGYGPSASTAGFGLRQFGENKVTILVNYATGNVLFGAARPPGSKDSAAAVVRPGDSGGAVVRKEDPNVLIGIVSLGVETVGGTEISFFTSIFPYRDRLLEIIRQADLAADAGVSASGSDAGLAP